MVVTTEKTAIKETRDELRCEIILQMVISTWAKGKILCDSGGDTAQV